MDQVNSSKVNYNYSTDCNITLDGGSNNRSNTTRRLAVSYVLVVFRYGFPWYAVLEAIAAALTRQMLSCWLNYFFSGVSCLCLLADGGSALQNLSPMRLHLLLLFRHIVKTTIR